MNLFRLEDMEVSNECKGQGVLADRSLLTEVENFTYAQAIVLDGIDRLFIFSIL